MCQYWSKLHTCSHVSDRPYVEMCHPGFIANIVCKDISTDAQPRPSYFPCYRCIKAEARAETLQRIAQERAAAVAAEAAREQALKAKVEAEKRAREERVRREAREKADRERAAEVRVRAEREAEREKAKKEGGAWTLAEAHGGRKKNKGRGSVLSSPSSLGASFAVGAQRKEAWKENGGKAPAWGEEKSANVSGRAGLWPPPKKILSRKDGAAGVLGGRPDGQGDANASGRK